MNSVTQVMKELKKCGSEQTRKIYARHGAGDNVFGVKAADLKAIAKKIKGKHELACELYETGNYDAMYLAGLVADGKQMSKKQLDDWAKSAAWLWISEYAVPWVASESPHGRDMAMKWIKLKKKEPIASCGWSTYASLMAITPDDELDLAEIKELLKRVEKEDRCFSQSREVHDERFRHRGGCACDAGFETGQGNREETRQGRGGHGRDGMQSAAGVGIHREVGKGRPGWKEAQNHAVLGGVRGTPGATGRLVRQCLSRGSVTDRPFD